MDLTDLAFRLTIHWMKMYWTKHKSIILGTITNILYAKLALKTFRQSLYCLINKYFVTIKLSAYVSSYKRSSERKRVER